MRLLTCCTSILILFLVTACPVDCILQNSTLTGPTEESDMVLTIDVPDGYHVVQKRPLWETGLVIDGVKVQKNDSTIYAEINYFWITSGTRSILGLSKFIDAFEEGIEEIGADKIATEERTVDGYDALIDHYKLVGIDMYIGGYTPTDDSAVFMAIPILTDSMYQLFDSIHFEPATI